MNIEKFNEICTGLNHYGEVGHERITENLATASKPSSCWERFIIFLKKLLCLFPTADKVAQMALNFFMENRTHIETAHLPIMKKMLLNHGMSTATKEAFNKYINAVEAEVAKKAAEAAKKLAEEHPPLQIANASTIPAHYPQHLKESSGMVYHTLFESTFFKEHLLPKCKTHVQLQVLVGMCVILHRLIRSAEDAPAVYEAMKSLTIIGDSDYAGWGFAEKHNRQAFLVAWDIIRARLYPGVAELDLSPEQIEGIQKEITHLVPCFFHGTSTLSLDNIRVQGMHGDAAANEEEMKQRQALAEAVNNKTLFGFASGQKKGLYFMTRTACEAFHYAKGAPEWFQSFLYSVQENHQEKNLQHLFRYEKRDQSKLTSLFEQAVQNKWWTEDGRKHLTEFYHRNVHLINNLPVIVVFNSPRKLQEAREKFQWQLDLTKYFDKNHTKSAKELFIDTCVAFTRGSDHFTSDERVMPCHLQYFGFPKDLLRAEQMSAPSSGNATAEEFVSCIKNSKLFTELTQLTEKEVQDFLRRGGSLNIITEDKIKEKPIELRIEEQIITGCNSGINRSQVAAAVLIKRGMTVKGVLAGGDSAMNPEADYPSFADPSEDMLQSATNFKQFFGMSKLNQIGVGQVPPFLENKEKVENAKKFYQNYLNELAPTHFVTFGPCGVSAIRRLLARPEDPIRKDDLTGFTITYIPWGDEIAHPPPDSGLKKYSTQAYERFATKFIGCFSIT